MAKKTLVISLKLSWVFFFFKKKVDTSMKKIETYFVSDIHLNQNKHQVHTLE